MENFKWDLLVVAWTASKLTVGKWKSNEERVRLGKRDLGLGSFYQLSLHLSASFLLNEGVGKLQKELACGLVEQFA